MEERLNELGGLWASYQITRDVETLYKASEFNSDVFFEFLGGDIPSICHDIIKESDERKYDLLTWRAKTLMEKPNVMRAYQMFQYYTNLIIREEELTGKANPNGLKIEALIINVYDLIQEYATEIERLSDIIYQEIPEEIEEGDYNDIDRVLRLNIVCENYKDLYEHIRDIIEDSSKIEDEVKLTVSDCNKLPKELNTKEAENLFAQISYCEKDGNLYKWNGTPSLFGHFVEMTSDALNIRPSNGRIPWSIYKQAFQMSEKSITTAKGKINRNRKS